MAFAARETFAISLHEAEFSPGEEIGVMLATFDPPTLQHDGIIRRALEQGKFNKLIVVPTDFTPHKPYRTQTPLRHRMLDAAYADHPNVLTIDPYHYGYPQSRGLIFALKQQYEVKITGVVLAEDLKSRLNSRVISWLLPTNDSLVLEEPSEGYSGGSSVIRNYFANHPDFFQHTEAEIEQISMEDLPVLLPVRKIIWETQLYHQNATRFGFVQDWFWATLYGRR
jgi:phosphopantetheine adenylyltransferase